MVIDVLNETDTFWLDRNYFSKDQMTFLEEVGTQI